MSNSKLSRCLSCGKQYHYYDAVIDENKGFCLDCIIMRMGVNWDEIRSKVNKELKSCGAVSKKTAVTMEALKEIIGKYTERQITKELCQKGQLTWTTRKNKKIFWLR